MIAITAAELAKIVGGKLFGDGSALITEAPVFDSRSAKQGSLFLALVGENTDGHNFVQDAFSRGATAALSTREIEGNCIVVRDVLEALSALAHHVREKLTDLTVIGITGSTGKTTAKDLLASLLTASAPTVSTMASFNNEIGLPITLLQCTPETKFCILEMGARHPGDIAALCAIARPTIGVVLKVGTAHVGEFGSVEKIAETKSELIQSLGKDGIAILGTYDSFTPAMARKHLGRVITFGEGAQDDVRAADIEIREGRPHFDLVTPAGRDAVGMRLVGEHQVANALAAAAVGTALGISIESIAGALSTAELKSKWRMEIHELEDLLLINDSYNANPESMAAALRSLALFAQERGGQSWAFLGAMHELGSDSAREHGRIGVLAEELGIDHLVCVNAPTYGEAIQGNSQMTLHYCASRDEALELASQLTEGDVLLVKASRSEGLEILAEALEDFWVKNRSEG